VRKLTDIEIGMIGRELIPEGLDEGVWLATLALTDAIGKTARRTCIGFDEVPGILRRIADGYEATSKRKAQIAAFSKEDK
jgi:hypothetical protein